MKNKLLFIITIFFLFNSCIKKGFEDRIKGIVGTWKFIGTYSFQFPSSRTGLADVVCTQKPFYLKINSDNTFKTYDTSDQKIYSGTIRSFEDKPFIFHIKHGFKSGKYQIVNIINVQFPFCQANMTDSLLGFAIDEMPSNYPNRNLFFDGSFSQEMYYAFKKI